MKSLYYIDMIWTPLVAITLIEFHLRTFGFTPTLAFTFAGGVLLWTFMEYVIHRVLHITRHPGHFRHHAYPVEQNGPGALQTIIVMALMYGIFQLIGGFIFASGFEAGLLSGLAVYLFVHHGIHLTTIFPNSKLRIMHENHHAGIGEEVFGVTTTLWDRLFNIFK